MSDASVSIGKPTEEIENGSLAGHAGIDGIEDAECAGAAAWLRHCEANRADERQSVGDQSRDSLSGAVEAGAGGFDCVGVGYVGEQSQGEVLPHHEIGEEGTGGGRTRMAESK